MIGFAVISASAILFIAALNLLRIDGERACRWYFSTITRLMGIRVIVRGHQSTARSRLVVANHVSYFDIFVLGGLVKGSFVAKAEISGWPIFGLMGRVGRTVFVDRKRTATKHARDGIRERLDTGRTLILFPESTSHDGNRVRPFKSALFTVAEHPTVGGHPVVVQPVSIAYTRLNGLPMGIGWRSFFAWYGDMDLMPHVWHALKLGKITAEVTFHEPVTISSFNNRKALAAHCTQVSGAGVARLLAGREAA
ncbi:MAG: 1-acyl-sn-glycerol-3-phosphate acyltransferase [Rhodospirillaceae bacterium]|nr:MAG: 1-acyl-sn-glycerol-3-phosphate acyltransferase [Rhodospirillaceae bacterium]